MKFTVLLSVYKKESATHLQTSIESIAEQSTSPDEILLIIDGPLTEQLEMVIENLCRKYPTLRIHRFDANVQLGLALKRGVELASNDLIARMDTDDIALPNRFEKQLKFMEENPDVSVLGGEILEFDSDSGFELNRKVMPHSHEEILAYCRFRNPFNHMTVMFRREDVLAVGNYRHRPFLEDYDLWSRLIAKGYKCCNVPDILVRVRTNTEQYGRRGGFAYCKRYLSLRKMQLEMGLFSVPVFLLSCVATIGMTVIPTAVRRFVYQNILRR